MYFDEAQLTPDMIIPLVAFVLSELELFGLSMDPEMGHRQKPCGNTSTHGRPWGQRWSHHSPSSCRQRLTYSGLNAHSTSVLKPERSQFSLVGRVLL
jgi:hypothetical protein